MCTQALRQARGQQRAKIEGQRIYYYSSDLFLTTENSLNFQFSKIKDNIMIFFPLKLQCKSKQKVKQRSPLVVVWLGSQSSSMSLFIGLVETVLSS